LLRASIAAKPALELTDLSMRFLSALLVVATAGVCAFQALGAPADAPPARQYTFSWKFLDESTLAPRGGTSQGAAVKLVTEPTDEWKALQQPGISAFEKDRRAILAMAGGYRASFDFIEVAGFNGGSFKPDRPYQSWGTEKVYVVEDKGTSIVLQHLLVMSMVDKSGQVQGPFVTKHWRQDWQYEPTNQIVYRGNNTWALVDVPRAQRAGQWRQTVYQVDDSPRYSGVARWKHLANYSSWSDEDGWRPLPRREYSVRNDYQVLVGNNRHTITPTGWVHEQRNLKAVIDDKGQAIKQVVGEEIGLNRYERITDIDWSAGDRYLQATAPVWSAVRKKWEQLFATMKTVRLKGAPDKDQLFMPLYEYAESMATADKPEPQDKIDAHVNQAVEAYLFDRKAATSTPSEPAKY
jgi:hypothetical protein